MNATGINKSLVILLGIGLTTGIASPACAQAPVPSSSSSAKELSRSDVDRLLADARSAIDSGDLARADQLVGQAEAAGVRYPLFHFGDTPNSVRRQLTRAESRNERSVESQSGGSGLVNALHRSLGSNEQENVDPFLAPGPNMPSPSSVGTDSGVIQASATSPYGNFGETAPRALPDVGTQPILGGAGGGEGPALTAGPIPESYPSTSEPNSEATAKQQATELASEARTAMSRGDLAMAAKLTAQASALNVPESQFEAGEDRPSQLAWELEQRRARDSNVQAAASPLSTTSSEDRYATPMAMMSATDALTEQSLESSPELSELRFAQLPEPEAEEIRPLSAQNLITAGEQALRDRDRDRALQLFNQADGQRSELDAAGQQRLDSHLQILSAAPEPLPPQPAAAFDSGSEESARALVASDSEQQVLARQLSSDVARIQSESRKQREKDPKQALHMLEEIRAEIAKSRLSEDFRHRLTRRVDLTIEETEQYI
ncbi:MAG: hypothetical protein ACR2NU_10600, partial [Aeoliella sp.]